MVRYFLATILLFLLMSAAGAQEISVATQRALIISSMAQQLGQAEVRNQALEGQLAQAQKRIEETKSICGAPCRDKENTDK